MKLALFKLAFCDMSFLLIAFLTSSVCLKEHIYCIQNLVKNEICHLYCVA